MSLRPCPVCGGARLRPESRAVLVAGTRIEDFTRAVGAARAAVAGGGRAVRDRPPRRAADPARDLRAAAVPRERRHRLPVDGPGRRDPVRRGGPADPAGDPDRLLAGGRAVHPRRALDRAAPARQLEADRDPRAAARPRQHGDRGRARRADDARRRPPRGPRPGRGRARRAGSWPRAPPSEVQRVPESLTGQYLSGARTIETPARAADAERLHRDPRRQPAQPARHRRARPAGRADVRHRGLRIGQVDARQRRPLQGRRQPPAPSPPAPRQPPGDPRPGPARQDHRGRPVADRAHAAVEPGHLHGAVRRDPGPVLQDPGGPRRAATSRAASASTSRAGAARSAAATGRSRSRCTSCPTCTCPANSATASATTARRSRSASRAATSPTCSTCPSRRRCASSSTSRRSAGGWRRSTPSGSATSASASRPRRCRAARPSA